MTGLSKQYGDTVALDRLDFTVAEGEVYGYFGPNGAGKTTMIRLLLGFHRASAGCVQLFGIDAWHDPVEAHKQCSRPARIASPSRSCFSASRRSPLRSCPELAPGSRMGSSP
jgi:ABC-type branched-subunit amino acid transport system ATPase component